jgi:hypothetical protein
MGVIKMAENDRIILDEVLRQTSQNIGFPDNPSRFFDFFSADQILKDYDFSYDEIISNIVDNGGDGGIDSFYAFVNGELLLEDSDISDYKKNITIEIAIIQSKTSTGFGETPIDKLISATSDLFDLSKPIDSFKGVYNGDLLKAVNNFRQAYQKLASKFPKLRISFFYATKADEVHPNVKRKTERLEDVVKGLFSSAEFDFSFLGAANLLFLARKQRVTSYELKLAENPISSTGDVAFVCLVSLSDFFKFITDSNKHLIKHIFEANVRDYQGKTKVNEEIQASLQNLSAEDFWWLNNGITVLATRATQSGKVLNIENPEIVNGLQTSTEIYNYFRTCNTESERRNLLIRVIVPNEQESRDRIIKATNSQTSIPSASLRATDQIHRNIEEYLRSFGLFYDRRKNFHKNEGKHIDKIVSIPQMAQTAMAILLKRPDSARARPSSLLQKDDEYTKLFSEEYPICIYRLCAECYKQVEKFLSSDDMILSAADKNNIKFYLAMVVVSIKLKLASPNISELAPLAGIPFSNEELQAAFELVYANYTRLGATDQVAKGPELLCSINSTLEEKYPKIFR